MTKDIRYLTNKIIKDKDYAKLRNTRSPSKVYRDKLHFLNQMEDYIREWHMQRTRR